MCFRIGHGYDVHKLVSGRSLILGGVTIPNDYGLLGHSDADVLVHAICDSLLGAAALGDIGKHFPDNDDRFKNISSLILLKKVVGLLAEKGYCIINIDSTVILQKPKIAEYIENMRKNIADACGIATEYISIKATTEEGLGFTGSCSGCASHAVCLISKKE